VQSAAGAPVSECPLYAATAVAAADAADVAAAAAVVAVAAGSDVAGSDAVAAAAAGGDVTDCGDALDGGLGDAIAVVGFAKEITGG